MITMSIEQIKEVAKNILNLEPYVETSEYVTFRFANFQSLHSITLERCGFPYYFVTPYCNHHFEAFLELVVCTHM